MNAIAFIIPYTQEIINSRISVTEPVVIYAQPGHYAPSSAGYLYPAYPFPRNIPEGDLVEEILAVVAAV